MSVIHNISLAEVNTATLHNLNWRLATAGSILMFKPGQVVVFKSVFGEPMAMQFVSSSGLRPVKLLTKQFHYCPQNQIDSIKIVTPEPGTLFLFGLGLASMVAWLRRRIGHNAVKCLLVFGLFASIAMLPTGVTAQEESCEYTVQKGGSGSGTVWVGDEECGVDCQTVQVSCEPQQASVLKAIPDMGSEVAGWQDGDGNPITEALLEHAAGQTIVVLFESVPWCEACSSDYEKSIQCALPVFSNPTSACYPYLDDALNCVTNADFEACIATVGAMSNKAIGCSNDLREAQCPPLIQQAYTCAEDFLQPCRDALLGVFRREDSSCNQDTKGLQAAEACLLDPQLGEHLLYNANCELMFGIINNDLMCMADVLDAGVEQYCSICPLSLPATLPITLP